MMRLWRTAKLLFSSALHLSCHSCDKNLTFINYISHAKQYCVVQTVILLNTTSRKKKRQKLVSLLLPLKNHQSGFKNNISHDLCCHVRCQSTCFFSPLHLNNLLYRPYLLHRRHFYSVTARPACPSPSPPLLVSVLVSQLHFSHTV